VSVVEVLAGSFGVEPVDPVQGLDLDVVDAKDAVQLARLLRLGEVTPVAVPSVDQEAARDLVRATTAAVI
jgi:transposase